MNSDAVHRAARVRFMAFDVDGIMTDGRLYMTQSGDEMKAFHTLDGQGIKLLKESGIEVALLTARNSAIVARRADELGIGMLRQGVSDKLAALAELLDDCKLSIDDAGYAGDDLVDLPVLRRCVFSASVPNAAEAVRSRVHYVTHVAAGNGAVRELCEFILQAQGKLDTAIARYVD